MRPIAHQVLPPGTGRFSTCFDAYIAPRASERVKSSPCPLLWAWTGMDRSVTNRTVRTRSRFENTRAGPIRLPILTTYFVQIINICKSMNDKNLELTAKFSFFAHVRIISLMSCL